MRILIQSQFILTAAMTLLAMIEILINDYPRTKTETLSQKIVAVLERLFWLGWMGIVLFVA